MNFFSSTLKAVKSNIQYDITYGSQSTYDLDQKLYDLDLLTPNECSEYDNIMYCCRKKCYENYLIEYTKCTSLHFSILNLYSRGTDSKYCIMGDPWPIMADRLTSHLSIDHK